MSFWKRNKRLLQSAALGAAGAAAAYTWWRSYRDTSEGRELFSWLSASSSPEGQQPQSNDESPEGPAAPPGNDDRSKPMEFDENVQRYFNSVQAITDNQTLPDWLQRLHDRLLLWTDFEALKAQLKGLQANSSEEATAQKVQLWQQLALASFTRTMAACWLIPLLDLYLRVKLNILGRHLYLESTLENLQPGRQWRLQFPGSTREAHPPLPPKLSSRAQEMYMNASSFFPDVGAKVVVDKMAEVVAQVVGEVDLKSSLQPGELVALMSSVHVRLEQQFTAADWASVLAGPHLPTPETFTTPEGASYPVHPLEAAMVDEMAAEVRHVLLSARFQEALVTAVKQTAKVAAVSMVSKFAVVGGAGDRVAELEAAGQTPGSPSVLLADKAAAAVKLQFPKVVGIVAASCEAMFDPHGRVSQGIATLPPVQSLCATVYACGPQI